MAEDLLNSVFLHNLVKIMIIDIEGIQIAVQRKKMKTMTLRICPPDGSVKISAPLRSSDIAIKRFAVAHIDWIQKQQSTFQKTCPQPHLYITGERHFLYGKEYFLRIHEGGKKSHIEINDHYIDMTIPENTSTEYRKKVLMNFHRELLQTELNLLIPYWETKIGVKADIYQIRVMKAHWGTCHPHARKIYFSLALIQHPIICLEYVIVHEIVHLLEASHNARFKAFMDKFMPEWRKYKALLNKHF